jgi:hypothetical protein
MLMARLVGGLTRTGKDDMLSTPSQPLDDWYRDINRIYLDQNFYRDSFSIFAHLVEVVGGLSLLETEKVKPNVEPFEFVSKAIAWWLALCGKTGIRSVEQMLWQKFPYACPYCEEQPHVNDPCVEKKQAARGPNWDRLHGIGKKNEHKRPRSLGQWQKMFFDIYPTGNNPKYAMPLARFTEELGELGEALRVSRVALGYFLSEASDLFAWLMNLQNVIHSQKKYPHQTRGAELEAALYQAYPGVCRDCGNPVCTCPPILPGTLGRIAHEIPVDLLGVAAAGPLMRPEEAINMFELGSPRLTIANATIEATPELVKELRETIRQLRFYAVENVDVAKAHSRSLAEAIAHLEGLTASQRVTQEAIDGLALSISTLPSESRQAVIGFLTGAGSSAWVTAIISAVGKLTGVA